MLRGKEDRHVYSNAPIAFLSDMPIERDRAYPHAVALGNKTMVHSGGMWQVSGTRKSSDAGLRRWVKPGPRAKLVRRIFAAVQEFQRGSLPVKQLKTL